MKNESTLWISHGEANHPWEQRQDCMDCIGIEIWYLLELQKAGGLHKFIEKLIKEK